MKKTLILVIDRDDDFGTKGHVVTPAIGMDACIEAATALGSADPEDSDTNALFAAINIYRNKRADGDTECEVALICGNKKVGYRSDEAIAAELDTVLSVVKPDNAILVGDGAEDEYTYPIVSSRVQVNSVRKVYVNQAPGVEGTFYIITKTLRDPQKRERFLAPVSFMIMAICAVYLFVNALTNNTLKEYVLASTTTFIIFIIGFLLMLYSYSVDEKISNMFSVWKERFKAGSILIVFFIAACIFIVAGVVIGLYSIDDVYTTRLTERVLLFATNSMWLILFGLIVYLFGHLIDRYVTEKVISYTFMTGCLNLIAIGLIMTGGIDLLIGYIGLYITPFNLCIAEIGIGLLVALLSAYLQRNLKRTSENTETDANEVL